MKISFMYVYFKVIKYFSFQVKHTLSRYTTEIAARCALGIDSNCFKDDKPEIHEMGKIVFEPDTLKGLKFLSFFIAPGIFKLLKLK